MVSSVCDFTIFILAELNIKSSKTVFWTFRKSPFAKMGTGRVQRYLKTKNMETLEATLEGEKRTASLKTYLVIISVDVPYPRQFEYRQSASSIAPAVARAIRLVKKEIKGKRIKEYRIKALQM